MSYVARNHPRSTSRTSDQTVAPAASNAAPTSSSDPRTFSRVGVGSPGRVTASPALESPQPASPPRP